MPSGSSRARPQAPSTARGRLPSVLFLSPPVRLRRSAVHSGFHPYPPAGAPFEWSSGAWPSHGSRSLRSPLRLALHLPGSRSAGSASTASADFSLHRQAVQAQRLRRPFRHKARSPRIRTAAFVAQPPDLRRFPLVARASRSLARSPWSTAPRIRFLFVGSRLRYPASFSAVLTARRLAVHFGPCDQVPGGLPPPDYHPCRAYQ